MEDEAEERLVVLKRMCKLSCVILTVAVATLLVGIMALTYSGGKFPFNAGGAIIAGIVATFLSFCPMCMLVQAKQYQKTRKSSYNCCCMALFFWSFIAILGIIFGLATNGIGAIIACNNRSKETGCWLNKESQEAFAIITVVLTSLMLILIITLYIICCCNCQLVGDIGDLPDYPVQPHNVNSLTQNEIPVYGIPGIDQSPGFTVLNSHGRDTNDGWFDRPANGRYITPTAPPVFTEYSSDTYFTSINTGMDIHDSINNEHDDDSRHFRYSHSFDSPPPSYNEVMENDPMETPL